MKLYMHEGPGHWIGSCVVVIAENPEHAYSVIRGILDSGGLPAESLNVKEIDIDRPAVIVDDNGDY